MEDVFFSDKMTIIFEMLEMFMILCLLFLCKRLGVKAKVISLALGHLRYRHKAYEDSLWFHSSDLYKESNRTGACEDGHDTWCFCI